MGLLNEKSTSAAHRPLKRPSAHIRNVVRKGVETFGESKHRGVSLRPEPAFVGRAMNRARPSALVLLETTGKRALVSCVALDIDLPYRLARKLTNLTTARPQRE